MVVKFKEYKQLDGSVRNQVSDAGGSILRRFDKTPFPEDAKDVICPHFMLLAWANGCPYNCAWCYLKGTFRFFPQKPNGRIPQIFKDRARIEKDIRAFLKADLPPEIIDTGELSDSLMDEGSRESLPFSEWLMQFFDGTKHKVMFLTKSTNIEQFLNHHWQKNAILAWSINAPKVSERWEMYAPTALQRLAAAQKVADAGYEVRLRIDPMVPIEDWKTEYAQLVKLIEPVKPSRVTLGCLRGLTTTIIYCKDKSWLPYLKEKSSWGKKPPFHERLEMYDFVIGELNKAGVKDVGVCKETLEMWNELAKVFPRMKYQKMTCNCVW
jgi:spore photoproduct lyase